MRALSEAPNIDDLNLFDGQCYVGPNYTRGDDWLSIETLLQLMDHHHIAESVVISSRVVLSHRSTPDIENERLLDEIGDNRRLHPCWVLDPRGTRRDEERRICAMLDRGVRIAMVYPKQVPLLPWLFHHLLTVLEAYRVPTIFEFNSYSPFAYGVLDKQDWASIYEIASIYRRLPIIIGGMAGTGSWDSITMLLQECGNVRFDTIHAVPYWTDLVRKFGAERFLWASRAPKYDPGMFVTAIQYAEGIGLEEKKLIAGGNLRRMIEAVGS